jgi:membrane-associated phospholipid phosphatase
MRISEWVLAAYFSYVTALSLILAVRPDIRIRTVVVNLLLLCLYGILLGVGRLRNSLVVEHLRNWIPLGLMLLAYKEMGWLAPPVHYHRLEKVWIVWDRVLLSEWRLRDLIESTGPSLPTVLELSYVLVYALPVFCMSMLYVYKKWSYAETLLVIYLLGLFLSYVQFPYWPSEPPRVVFPGEHAPTVDTLVRRFNQWILGGYGIHTSVFPSAHVSGAFAAAFALKRILGERPWLYRGVFVYAVLVAVATVYGRYHFAVDAVAGMVVGGVAAALGNALVGRFPDNPERQRGDDFQVTASPR